MSASNSKNKVLLYGAYGYTGKLVVAHIKAKYPTWFSQCVLAGRSEEKLLPLSLQYDLPARPFSLNDPATMDANLKDIFVVLHMAGPFAYTARPMLEACCRTKTHYLDISGEHSSFRICFEDLAQQVKDSGVVCIPGVGFDVVPTDCLASLLKEKLPDACYLELAAHVNSKSGQGLLSTGTMKSALAQFRNPETANKARINHELIVVSPVYKTKVINFKKAGKKLMGYVSWGDTYTAYISTGIPTIDFYFGISSFGAAVAPIFLPLTSLAMKIPGFETLVGKVIDWFVAGPDEEARSGNTIEFYGQATNIKGDKVEGGLETGEGYRLTAIAASYIVDRLFQKQLPPGSYTPSKAFGHEMLKDLETVEIYDLHVSRK